MVTLKTSGWGNLRKHVHSAKPCAHPDIGDRPKERMEEGIAAPPVLRVPSTEAHPVLGRVG